jgi:hypothetical protein
MGDDYQNLFKLKKWKERGKGGGREIKVKKKLIEVMRVFMCCKL